MAYITHTGECCNRIGGYDRIKRYITIYNDDNTGFPFYFGVFFNFLSAILHKKQVLKIRRI
jgi:hypothetical protein